MMIKLREFINHKARMSTAISACKSPEIKMKDVIDSFGECSSKKYWMMNLTAFYFHSLLKKMLITVLGKNAVYILSNSLPTSERCRIAVCLKAVLCKCISVCQIWIQ